MKTYPACAAAAAVMRLLMLMLMLGAAGLPRAAASAAAAAAACCHCKQQQKEQVLKAHQLLHTLAQMPLRCSWQQQRHYLQCICCQGHYRALLHLHCC
jgi:hypothetical protein